MSKKAKKERIKSLEDKVKELEKQLDAMQKLIPNVNLVVGPDRPGWPFGDHGIRYC